MTALVRGQLGIAALITAAGAAAADNLPPLRVDPALLGITVPAAKPKPAATAPASPPAAETVAPVVPAAVVSPVVSETVAPLPAPAKTNSQSTPPAKTPASTSAPAQASNPRSTPSALSATPVQPTPVGPVAAPTLSSKPQATPVVPAAAAAALQERPVKAPPAPEKASTTLAGLPPFRVDPALLGAPPAAKPREAAGTAVASGAGAKTAAAAVAGTHVPPDVSEQPRVPPLYSAHVKAGMLPADTKNSDAIYLAADRMDGRTDQEMIASGNVELRKRDATLTADKVTYWPVDDEVEAEGNVKLVREVDRITGPKMRLNLTESTGYFDKPNYSVRREIKLKQTPTTVMQMPGFSTATPATTRLSTGTGHAERIDFEGEGQYKLKSATYSTCTGDNPDWYAEFDQLKLDYDQEAGTGNGAMLVFKNVPVLYSPWMTFSLNNKRKTGLLAPTFVSNTSTGFQYVQPFYWNIAPNMDSTITSRTMARRGVQLNADLRYIDFNYNGQSRFEYLPDDKVAHKTRSAYSVVHNQNFGAGFSGGLNLNGVSDDTYFTDLTTKMSLVSQGNLVRQGNVAYSGGWWSANVMAQSYQTLQDPLAPIVPPYARLPQATVVAVRPDLPLGTTFSFAGEYAKFDHPTLVTGQRTVFYPQLSLPMQTAAFYVTPKVGIHETRYTLQKQGAGIPDNMSRQVPISSIDSGVTFDRNTDWFGRNMNQTLEPRLYYVYIPRVQQSNIPVFDSALADFNFAQIFSENRYVGSDRIGDANQLTAAVTSRLIDPNTGTELIRGMLGQRYYFSNQTVTLPGEKPRTSNQADWLAALTGLVMPRTYVDTGVQYNPTLGRTERFNAAARYQPELGKVVSAGYRYTRDSIGQIDISGQWPLSGRWSGVGRVNYSTKDQRMIEGVAGFEYNAGCWAVRGVMQQLSTTAQTQTTSFFLQLELSDFSNIGSNPNEILRRNVPGYSRGGQFATDATSLTNQEY